jgi:hypothetical protein
MYADIRYDGTITPSVSTWSTVAVSQAENLHEDFVLEGNLLRYKGSTKTFLVNFLGSLTHATTTAEVQVWVAKNSETLAAGEGNQIGNVEIFEAAAAGLLVTLNTDDTLELQFRTNASALITYTGNLVLIG